MTLVSSVNHTKILLFEILTLIQQNYFTILFFLIIDIHLLNPKETVVFPRVIFHFLSENNYHYFTKIDVIFFIITNTYSIFLICTSLKKFRKIPNIVSRGRYEVTP